MKKLRYLCLLLLCAVLVAGMLSGCADFIRIDLLGLDPAFVAYLDAPEQYVLFRSNYEGSTEENVYVPLEEILAYQTQYPDCNGTYFRDQLSGEDLAIYNAHLYALENSHGYFELFVANNEKDFTYIREYLSLDTPFLEQNFNTEGETVWLWDEGDRIGFSMEQFSAQGRSDRCTGCGPEPSDDHRLHGRYHDDRFARPDRGGSGGPVRPVFLPDVQRILGVCRWRYAVLLPVLRRKG